MFKKLNTCHAMKHIMMRYRLIFGKFPNRKDIGLINHVIRLYTGTKRTNYNKIPNTMNKTFLAQVNEAMFRIENDVLPRRVKSKTIQDRKNICQKAKELNMTGLEYTKHIQGPTLHTLECNHNKSVPKRTNSVNGPYTRWRGNSAYDYRNIHPKNAIGSPRQ
jgi:hypothetical protein